ncbi:MAG: UDP-N-acetylglucosamine diphosphorylase/glucosamine-1-phosphate N-acetyltransferase [Actinobacteria bacterium]|nr:MAG: UDP-N-acetylglucosamine diphosphorylase/glucosamine-1-phosphate N-acetyltransferase [Actinomycetota bacterium]
MPKPPARALAAIVMAAGESKRFKTKTPKVLHDLAGRPLIAHVLSALKPLRLTKAVVVTGRGANQVEATIKDVTFARQEKQLGTADAARTGDEALGDFQGDVLVLPGDTPLVTTKTLRVLIAYHRNQKAAATILTAKLDYPTGYGRIVRTNNDVDKIVEQTDATEQQRQIKEVNGGIYVFDRAALRSALTKVERANKQKEFYLTDVIAILKEKGEKVLAKAAPDPIEILGINDRAQLALVAKLLRQRTNATLMRNGVTIVDPDFTYIDPTVKVGPDTVIHPPTFLHGATRIGEGCEIGPGARITDSRIDDGATVIFSVLDNARVGAQAQVGPYAYLRPGARLAKNAKVGTFVEVKASEVGEGSKVPHLSYIGDTVIGRDVNVGAATVTVNYDPETKIKAKTVIHDGAKIGSDTMLIAPVKVGKRAVTGAGSVVTKDVPAETVVVGNPARPLRKRKKPKGDG